MPRRRQRGAMDGREDATALPSEAWRDLELHDHTQEDDVAALSEALALVDECGLVSLEDLGLEGEFTTSSSDAQASGSPATSPTADVGTATATATTKAKRSSGQSTKEELTYLRTMVKQLETELAQLKKQSEDTGVPATPLARVWEDVATRQSQERQRAEVENAKLRLLVEEQLRVAKVFERLLKKRSLEELLGPTVRQANTRKRLGGPSDAVEGLWGLLQSMHTEVDDILSSDRFSSTVLPLRNIHVRTDEVFGTVVEAVEKRVAPFGLEQLAEATWHQMAHHTHADGEIHHGHHVHVGDDRFTRDFVVELDSTRLKATFTGSIVAQRLVEDGRVVFVWISTMKPADLAHGAEGMRQKAYVVLSKVSDEYGEPVTLLKALLLFQPIRSDDLQQRRVVGALTNFVLTSVSLHFEEARQHVENALLQKTGR